MATNPVKGKSFQGEEELKQGLFKLSNASGNTWTKPVDRMTPAAKALIIKKRLFSGSKAETRLPRIGRETPIPLAIKMERTPPVLYFNARFLSLLMDCSVLQSLSSAETSRGWFKRQQRKRSERMVVL